MKYTKSNLEKLADEVISISKDHGDSLVAAVLKVLKDNPMNPEQTRRLVEMTNTSKFLDSFKDTFGDDRFVDFDVLDPEDIIQRVFADKPNVDTRSRSLAISIDSGPAGTLVTRRENNDPGLDTEESRFFDNVEETKEKSAAFYKVAEELESTDKYDDNPHLKGKQSKLPDAIQKKIIASKLTKEKKTAEELESTDKYDDNPHLKGKQSKLPDAIQKKIIASKSKKKMLPHDEKRIEEKLLTKKESSSYECDHIAESLSLKFKGIYSSKKHAGFEQEALANYGVDALPALQAVRSKLGMPLFTSSVSPEAVKKASEHYVSDKNSLGMYEVGRYIEKLGQYIDANLELSAFYKYTEKTAAVGLGGILSSVGLGMGANNLLSDPLSTSSYILDKRINNWADRTRARDETIKQTRKKVVDYALDGIENKLDNFFDSAERSSIRKNQKARRLIAAKTMFKENPDLRSVGKANALMAINMVGKVAPELSTSVPFLTAHVKQMVYNSDGGIPVIDAQSIKSMSEAERAFENLGRFKPA